MIPAQRGYGSFFGRGVEAWVGPIDPLVLLPISYPQVRTVTRDVVSYKRVIHEPFHVRVDLVFGAFVQRPDGCFDEPGVVQESALVVGFCP